MKQLLRRVVTKDGVAIKQLPYVIEHDAIKAVFTESDKQTLHSSEEYRQKNEIDGDTIEVYHITIKWVDGETSNISITSESGDELFNFVFLSFENIYNSEITYEDEEDDDEYDEDDYDEEGDYDEEAEEEIEEELLEDEKQLKFVFPQS